MYTCIYIYIYIVTHIGRYMDRYILEYGVRAPVLYGSPQEQTGENGFPP